MLNIINSTSKKTAAVFSYIFLAINSVSSILLTPLFLKFLGVDEFGLYQMVYSIGQYILILDLGIGSVMIRYIAEYRAREDYVGMKQFAGMIAFLTLLICILVLIVGIVTNANLENIFTDLSTNDYAKSHWMMGLMTYQFVITIIDHYFQGAISAHEHFVYSKVLGIIKVCAVFILTLLFVSMDFGAVGIVMANAIVITLLTLLNAVYTFKVLKFHIIFTSWKKSIMIPVFGLMMAMFLQAIVANVNSSVDKTILGIMCTPTDVAIYSIAATIITLFNTLPTVMSGLFQPQVMRMVVNGTNGSKLTDLVIRVGRWQFMLCGAFFAGLVLFGMDFLTLWVGNKVPEEGIRFSLIIMLIILPFNMIPLIQNVCISILNAYDKRLYRSIILILISILHIIFTVVIIKYWGPIGSPIGTAISYFFGYAILLNVYYYKYIHLEVFRMLKEISGRLSLCILFSSLLCLPLYSWNISSWFGFVVKVLVFSIVLFTTLYLTGFNKEEKDIINSYILGLPIIKQIIH